jgi:ribosomal protein L21E
MKIGTRVLTVTDDVYNGKTGTVTAVSGTQGYVEVKLDDKRNALSFHVATELNILAPFKVGDIVIVSYEAPEWCGVATVTKVCPWDSVHVEMLSGEYRGETGAFLAKNLSLYIPPHVPIYIGPGPNKRVTVDNNNSGVKYVFEGDIDVTVEVLA